ncbi:cysteine-rich motor neuron 1 protein-like isoform X2 [Cimex lectularius]|uniref:Cysteine-rich motor neuron 1 protein n=1 Tax=Cimex lectularius TaxID=79782 RepID=A0A8I6RUD2_CIMLE|nr:cysteine-rich motor neuron 1 protein-like isoform X2 [Cimex lectularius]
MKITIWLLLVGLCAAKNQVGLNCSADEDCDDKSECPSDSILDLETKKCICAKEHCMPLMRCQYKTKLVLKHNATGVPGDCCDVYECVSPSENNCIGVTCPKDEIKCPNDSLPLPRKQAEGECCSVPQGCECLPGPCPGPTVCPKGQFNKVRMAGTGEPGSCCPVYECQLKNIKTHNCIYEGKEISDNSTWKMNGCLDCWCIKGMVLCTKSQPCVPIPPDCPKISTPRGQCCPVCISNSEPELAVKPGGCKSSKGVIYENGASWEEDDCTTCVCLGGMHKCQAAMCQHNGNGTIELRVPSNCPFPANCKLKCKYGFALDEHNCYTCRCNESDCTLNCPNGYAKDENGEQLCECLQEPAFCPPLDSCTKECKHGFKMNRQGCPICKCDHCKTLVHCTKRCHHGYQTNSKGCSICKCKPSSMVNGSINHRVPTGCNTDGENPKEDGEVWFDGCRQCYCYAGKEMCSLIACPKLDCPDAIVSKNSCCPVCPGNETRSGMHVVCYGRGGLKFEGDSWTEDCAECICHNGVVMCYKEMCPPVLCTNPIPPTGGKCCPTCPQALQLPLLNSSSCGVDRPPGSEWRQDSCVSCICINGVADCYTETCNQIDLNCKHPIQVKNQCCPRCFDSFRDPNVCKEGNVTFNVGDEWEQEKCRRCTCEPGGTIICTQSLCDNPCSANKNCKENDGSESKLLFPVLCFLMGIIITVLFVIAKRCCHPRDQLTICQTGVPTHYQYKNVPSYDNPTPSPVKSLV